METSKMIEKLKEWQKQCAAYSMVLSTVYYDKETIAPKMGSEYRNNVLSYMSGEAYNIEVNEEIIKLLDELSNKDLGEELNREVYLNKKSLENISKFTKEEVMEFDKLTLDSWDAWYKAKKENNYSIFEPYLKKLFEAQRNRSIRRNPNKNPYDVCLDDYEESMTMEKYEEFFSLIKRELIPLIKIINTKQNEVDDSFLHKYYPIDKQKKFAEVLLHYLRFEDWGYMGISEHPFTDGISRNDVRITTSYDEYNIASTIFSIIHETGHAYYEHQVDEKYDDTKIRQCISSGMHESQSRFLENYIGRTESFWNVLYPKLQELFPENLKDVTLTDFVRAINASKSSLVRTEADELTYPIHILIRYEIEKGVFDGSISCENLNEVWNKKYKDYLDIDVSSDTDGILQDVHWSGASFGYFPTYALGSAIGAQLLNTVKKELDIDSLLANDEFVKLEEYLKEKIHFDGALHDYNYILKRATNEEFNPKYYIEYLKEKYSKLYNVK